TIALALGARRMLGRNALIRRLEATETLGSVTVICTDKTGTLTQNRMTVEAAQLADGPLEMGDPPPPERPAAAWLWAAAALCNDSEVPADGARALGDATEVALAEAAAHAGLSRERLEPSLPRCCEIPFDAELRRMTTYHRRHGPALPEGLGGAPELADSPFLAFTKGALEAVLEIAGRQWSGDRILPLDGTARASLKDAEAHLADRGMRVLALAVEAPKGLPQGSDEPTDRDLILLGLVGLRDPLRPTVHLAVKRCRQAGIRPVMITGDHPRTAAAIAREAGIDEEPEILTGVDLAGLAREELEQAVDRVDVFARVSPKDKLNIVLAFQARGHLVAMTGDGVNDAPGLQRADIGVAMGITGTDVAKEAAEVVLLDDDFSTIVGAVEEGRTIYDNIRRFVVYILASNAGEVTLMLLAPLLGMPLPLLPLQILWINLVT
ncbi:MAG: HAD-IC family P-type ATPase, partial [Acidobacteria bacterium]|nr:HAD-IC family P-type ATPase [Acidobacteriota bacterium]